jgi:predicted kinase
MKCIILIGLPYSGKSTFINKLKDYVIISSDNYLSSYAEKQTKSYNEVFDSYIKTATELSNQDFYNAVKEKKKIIIDKTNLTRKSRKFWIDKLKNAGYVIEAVVFKNLTDEEFTRRVELRSNKYISNDIINQMKTRYQEPSKEEGFSSIIYIGYP